MSAAAVHATVMAMVDQIGQLRQNGVAIDAMPPKLQQVRQLLRELDAELQQRAETGGQA